MPAARGSGAPRERETAWRAAIDSHVATPLPIASPPEYEVEADFILARDRAEELNPLAQQGADLDNLAKVLLDSLKPVLVAGDGAVTALHLTKRRAGEGEASGVHVRIR